MIPGNIDKHLSDEELVALIDNIDALKQNSHINECDKCFLRYCSLSVSLSEITNTKFEVTPDYLLDKVKAIFKLKKSNSTKKVIPGKSLDLSRLILNIFKPKVVIYAAITIIILVIMIPIFQSDDESITSDDVRGILDQAMNNQMVVDRLNSDNMFKLKVTVSADTLIISQPFNFERNVNIYSKEDSLIYSITIENSTNLIKLPEDVLTLGTRLIVTTLDTVVFDETFNTLFQQ